MANDFLYVFCKGGDKRPAGNKEYLGLFHGMVVDAFDPYLRYGKNDIIGDLQKKVYAILKCPKTWTDQIRDAIQMYNPDNLDLTNISTLKRYRQRKGYVDFEELGVLLNMLTLDSDILSPNAIPIIDCMKLTPSIFKDATKKEFVQLSGTKDFNAHSEGTFDWGDTGSGDDFDTRTLCMADIANLTNDLTYQHNHSNNENATGTITETIGDGLTLKFTNNNPPEGDPTQGNKSTITHNLNDMVLQAEGSGVANTGILQIEKQLIQRTGSSGNNEIINIQVIAITHTIKINNNMIEDNGNLQGTIRSDDVSPVCFIWNNVIWRSAQGGWGFVFGGGDWNASNIIENNTIYNFNYGYHANNNAGTMRNNLVINNILASFRLIATATVGRNNAADDATGEDGDFFAGSGNQSNVVILDEVLSVDDTLSTFMYAKAGGVCESGGVAPGIPDNVTGIRGRPRTGPQYTIGAAEILRAITVEAAITITSVALISQAVQADVQVSRSENSIQTVSQSVQKDAQANIVLNSVSSVLQTVQADLQAIISENSVSTIVSAVQKDALASVTLDSIPALVNQAQADLESGLTLDSVSVVTLVAIITGMITPDKRSFTVWPEDRSFTVYKEDRSFTVPIEDRTFTVKKEIREFENE